MGGIRHRRNAKRTDDAAKDAPNDAEIDHTKGSRLASLCRCVSCKSQPKKLHPLDHLPQVIRLTIISFLFPRTVLKHKFSDELVALSEAFAAVPSLAQFAQEIEKNETMFVKHALAQPDDLIDFRKQVYYKIPH